MPVMSVDELTSLKAAKAALLALPGFTELTPAVLNLSTQIAKNSGTQARSWVLKVDEIGAEIRAKAKRVFSKADGEASYDAGKLLHELDAMILWLQSVKSQAAENGVV